METVGQKVVITLSVRHNFIKYGLDSFLRKHDLQLDRLNIVLESTIIDFVC